MKLFKIKDNRSDGAKYTLVEIILICIFGLIIFFTGIYSIRNLYGITIGVDDFGYISNAAYMVGRQWKDLSEIMPYYSFGYSIILILFLLCFSNPVFLFRAIIIFNVCLLVLTYYISLICIKKIHIDINNKIIILICFAANMYTANFVYAKYILAESLIGLLFWIITLLILSILDKFTNVKFVFLSLICCYLYFVHQRTIVITFSLFLMLSILLIKKQISRKSIFIFFIIFGLGFFVGNIFKNTIIQDVYFNNSNVATNNFSGQVGKLNYILTVEGFISFIKGLTSKIYYFLLATLFIGGFGILHFTKSSINEIKLVFKPNVRYKNSKNIIYIFFFLCFISSLLLQSFSLVYPNRYDLVIYGRYIEFMFVVVISEGMIFLYLNKKNILKELFIFIIIAIIGGIAAISLFEKFNLSLVTSYLAPTLYRFFSGNLSLVEGVYVSLLGTVILAAFIYFIYFMNNYKFKKNLFIALPLLLSSFWLSSTIYIDKDIIQEHTFFKDEYMPIVDLMKNNDLDVGFLLDKDSFDANRFRQLQFLMPNKTMKRITYENLELFNDNYLIIIEKNSEYMKDIKNKGKVFYENYRYVLWKP